MKYFWCFVLLTVSQTFGFIVENCGRKLSILYSFNHVCIYTIVNSFIHYSFDHILMNFFISVFITLIIMIAMQENVENISSQF